MKKLILVLSIALFFFGCKDSGKTTAEQPETRTAQINFMVSNGANISSYNVYSGDDLVMQLAASTDSNITYSVDDELSTSEKLNSLSYSVEPIFMDSASANTEIKMSLSLNSKVVAENQPQTVLYGQDATIEYTVE